MTEVTGAAFPGLMRELVLGPAGMASSTYDQPLPPAVSPSAATGYLADGEPLPGGRNTYPELAPAGLWTTPSDLARFAIALQDADAGAPGAVIGRPLAELMLTSQLDNFGLGLHLSPPGEPAWFEHGGDNAGFHAELQAFTSGRRQGVVIMTNGEGGRQLVPEVLRAVSKTYGWTVARTEELEIVHLAAADLAALAGAYEIPGFTKIAITAEGDRLYLTVAALGPERSELLAQTRDKFFVLANGVAVEFVRDASGVPTKMAISGPYGEFQAVRATP
jgi:CubicO group peptidase (beta-lactamase class C family)